MKSVLLAFIIIAFGTCGTANCEIFFYENFDDNSITDWNQTS